jgi:3-deoxy-D-manno-octulosonate 8-phosphate phosphatase (KDO 8-P phosphatase)
MEEKLAIAIQKAKLIKAAIFDIDGVLTDGKIYFTSEGFELKAFHSQDGLGLKMMLKAGIEIAIITARQSEIVNRRMTELGVMHVFQGQENKLVAYERIKQILGLEDSQVAYTGDDLNDLPLIRRSGLGIAVANATPLLHQYADLRTLRLGGAGAAREVCEFILSAQNLLEPIYEQYL